MQSIKSPFIAIYCAALHCSLLLCAVKSRTAFHCSLLLSDVKSHTALHWGLLLSNVEYHTTLHCCLLLCHVKWHATLRCLKVIRNSEVLLPNFNWLSIGLQFWPATAWHADTMAFVAFCYEVPHPTAAKPSQGFSNHKLQTCFLRCFSSSPNFVPKLRDTFHVLTLDLYL